MVNGIEYYYLLGLDINLEKYGLGRIKQLKLIDYLEKDISIDGFYIPFLMNEYIVKQSKNVENTIKLRNQLGSLTFLLISSYEGNNMDIIKALLGSVSILYGTEATVDEKYNIQVGDITISNDNFDLLCDVVLEMLKIDKSKFKFEKQDDSQSDIIKEFERRRKQYEQNSKKKKSGLDMVDIINAIIHNGNFRYEDLLNMTIYQIKNSFEVLSVKESFDVNTLYRISPKFDMSKDKYEHWTEKIKLDKSTLSQ